MKNEERITQPAVLVGLNTRKGEYERDLNSLEELSLLAASAGYLPKAAILKKKDRIDPACYIGSGKAQELRSAVSLHRGAAVLFDFELTAVQIRNLEKILECRVVTRTEIILDIFEKRARTKEAQLQVELATLTYSMPRLRHMWPHLNRIAGYIGARGPGEKQIESDRRRLAKRIHKIKQELVGVKTHRMVMRKGRAHMNKAALVGYTNSGKSSLLNALSHATLHTENRLFSTLDPATREVWLGEGVTALVTDTVGFIKRLPHTLIASFRATLEEVREADILIHVIDISSPDPLERVDAVHDVLREISADALPVLHVFNKTDLLASRDTKSSLLTRFEDRVLVSAKTGEGLPELKEHLLRFFRKNSRRGESVGETALRESIEEAAGSQG